MPATLADNYWRQRAGMLASCLAMAFFVPHIFNFAERRYRLIILSDHPSQPPPSQAKPTQDTLESDEDDDRISKKICGTAELAL